MKNHKPVYPKFSQEDMEKIKDAANMIGCKAITTFCEIAAVEKANRIISDNKIEGTLSKLKRAIYYQWPEES